MSAKETSYLGGVTGKRSHEKEFRESNLGLDSLEETPAYHAGPCTELGRERKALECRLV